jgi:hypothetical protein
MNWKKSSKRSTKCGSFPPSARKRLAAHTKPLANTVSRPDPVSAEVWKTVRKLYAAGILVYFGASGVLAIPITDFSDWASFMGRQAAYAFAWPAAAVAQVRSWHRSGFRGWL